MSLVTVPDPAHPDVDRKRHAWVLSPLVPTLVGLGPVLYRAWPSTFQLWLAVVFVYAVAPISRPDDAPRRCAGMDSVLPLLHDSREVLDG